MRLQVLPHVVPLDELPGTEWAIVWFFSGVDLAMSVERTRIGQFFVADFAHDHRFAVGSKFYFAVFCKKYRINC